MRYFAVTPQAENASRCAVQTVAPRPKDSVTRLSHDTAMWKHRVDVLGKLERAIGIAKALGIRFIHTEGFPLNWWTALPRTIQPLRA